MRSRILLFILSCCWLGCAVADDLDHDYSVYLVRHAEKQSGGERDPVLTEAGQHRAEQLANWFQDKAIKDIWSSDYHRTRDTVKPLLSSHGLELMLYDPRDLPALSAKLLNNQNNALVVGHSNTTPELARLLCDCVIGDMDESEYDRLIVVSVVDGETRVEILQQNTLFRQH
jgi:phosphohistidine phosphatase SixA